MTTKNKSLEAVNEALAEINNGALYLKAINTVRDEFGLSIPQLATVCGEPSFRTIESHIRKGKIARLSARIRILEHLQARLEGRIKEPSWDDLGPEFLEKVVGELYDTSEESRNLILTTALLLTEQQREAIIKGLEAQAARIAADGAKHRSKKK